MSERVEVLAPSERPSGHRSVPLLAEHDLGHYPEFRDHLAELFDLARDPFGPPGLLRVGERHYELVFFGSSGRAFPAALAVDALVPGLEPMDLEATDNDLWAILEWLVAGVGEPWTVEGLRTTGRIYKVPAAMETE